MTATSFQWMSSIVQKHGNRMETARDSKVDVIDFLSISSNSKDLASSDLKEFPPFMGFPGFLVVLDASP